MVLSLSTIQNKKSGCALHISKAFLGIQKQSRYSPKRRFLDYSVWLLNPFYQKLKLARNMKLSLLYREYMTRTGQPAHFKESKPSDFENTLLKRKCIFLKLSMHYCLGLCIGTRCPFCKYLLTPLW